MLDNILGFEWVKGYDLKTSVTDTLTLGAWQYIRILVEGNHNVLNPDIKSDIDPWLSVVTWLAGIVFIFIRIGFQWSKWKSLRLDNKIKEERFELEKIEKTSYIQDIEKIRIMSEEDPKKAHEAIEKQTKTVEEEHEKRLKNGQS